MTERFNGFIVTRNTVKRQGFILSDSTLMPGTKQYFYFEGESAGFDFTRYKGQPLAVTFTVTNPLRPGSFPLARNIELDRDWKEQRYKDRFGANYHTPEERRAYQASLAAKTSTVLVAGE